MLEQVPTFEESKIFHMFRLDVKEDVNVSGGHCGRVGKVAVFQRS